MTVSRTWRAGAALAATVAIAVMAQQPDTTRSPISNTDADAPVLATCPFAKGAGPNDASDGIRGLLGRLAVQPAGAAVHCPYEVTDSGLIGQLGTNLTHNSAITDTAGSLQDIFQRLSDGIGQRGSGGFEVMATTVGPANSQLLDVARSNAQAPSPLTGFVQAAAAGAQVASQVSQTSSQTSGKIDILSIVSGLTKASDFVQSNLFRPSAQQGTLQAETDLQGRRRAVASNATTDGYAIALTGQQTAATAPQRVQLVGQAADSAETLTAQKDATNWALIAMLQELQANRVVDVGDLFIDASAAIADGEADGINQADAQPFKAPNAP